MHAGPRGVGDGDEEQVARCRGLCANGHAQVGGFKRAPQILRGPCGGIDHGERGRDQLGAGRGAVGHGLRSNSIDGFFFLLIHQRIVSSMNV
ncbi:MAG: hypothetical protein ACK55I_31725 [bacterium]